LPKLNIPHKITQPIVLKNYNDFVNKYSESQGLIKIVVVILTNQILEN
jgi:hypothetical protein